MINTHIIYVSVRGQQTFLPLTCQTGSSVMDAINQSGILHTFAEELTTDTLCVGIFSHKIASPAQHLVKDGDRIEIYRPLLCDPKDIRRNRAKINPVGKRKPRPNEQL